MNQLASNNIYLVNWFILNYDGVTKLDYFIKSKESNVFFDLQGCRLENLNPTFDIEYDNESNHYYSICGCKQTYKMYSDRIIKCIIDYITLSERQKTSLNYKNKFIIFYEANTNKNCGGLDNNTFIIIITAIIINNLKVSNYSKYNNVDLDDCMYDHNNNTNMVLLVDSISNDIYKYLDMLIYIKYINGYDKVFLKNSVFKILKNIENLNNDNFYIFKIKKQFLKTEKSKKIYNFIVINPLITQSIHEYINILQSPQKVISVSYDQGIHISTGVFIFKSIYTISQNINKKNTIINDMFIDFINITSGRKLYFDYEMLDAVSVNVVSEKEKLIAGTLDYLKIDNVVDYSSLLNNLKMELDSKENENNTILKNMYSEVVDIESEIINKKIIDYYNGIIILYNKNNKTSINLLCKIDNLDIFLKNNPMVFFRKTNVSDSDVRKYIYSVKRKVYKNYIEYLNYDNLMKFNEKRDELKILKSQVDSFSSKLVSLNYCIDIINYIKSNNIEHAYFLMYVDFRGRLYHKSPISIQSSWLYRYIYHYGEIKGNYQKNTATFLNDDYLYNKIHSKFKGDDNSINILLSIGFLFKSEINSKNGFYNLVKIVKLGLEKYENFEKINMCMILKMDDKKDAMQFYYYCNILNKIKSESKLCMWYLIKDSTASMCQHSVKVLGCKEDKLKYLNLDNTEYYFDTYDYYLNRISDNFSNEKDLLPLLKRKYFKKLIMTIIYGVGKKKAMVDFLNILDDNKIKNNDRVILLKYFYKIYTFLKTGTVENDLYILSINSFQNKCYSGDDLCFDEFILDDITMGNYYYEVDEKDIKFLINKKILTVKYSIQNYKKIDKKKTKIALFVNFIHFLDAKYLRNIITQMNGLSIPVVSIHDAFFIPFDCYEQLIETSNKSFDLKEGDIFNLNYTRKIISYTIVI